MKRTVRQQTTDHNNSEAPSGQRRQRPPRSERKTSTMPRATSQQTPTCVQPDHFYPTGADTTKVPDPPGTLYDPNDDPACTRGIPVFKPTMDEFADFEAYMTKVDVWGRRSGIVKIIPPAEW